MDVRHHCRATCARPPHIFRPRTWIGMHTAYFYNFSLKFGQVISAAMLSTAAIRLVDCNKNEKRGHSKVTHRPAHWTSDNRRGWRIPGWREGWMWWYGFLSFVADRDHSIVRLHMSHQQLCITVSGNDWDSSERGHGSIILRGASRRDQDDLIGPHVFPHRDAICRFTMRSTSTVFSGRC